MVEKMGEAEPPRRKPQRRELESPIFGKMFVSSFFAAVSLQPLDIVKVRMQLGQGSALQVTSNMLRNEGVRAFYKGLPALLLGRVASYSVGYGAFMCLKKARAATGGRRLSQIQSGSFLIGARAIATYANVPATIALIRLQADATLPPTLQRNYANTFHALYRIVADDGLLALWRGAGPTVLRNLAYSTGFTVSYGPTKKFLNYTLGSNTISGILGQIIPGMFGCALSMPFDYVKTQIQKMQPNTDGIYPYNGPADCFRKTLRWEGPLRFYIGYPVYCLKMAPNHLITIIFFYGIQRLGVAVTLSI